MSRRGPILGTLAAAAMAGVAAGATTIARRNRQIARRPGSAEGLGKLRSDPITVVADDGVGLHAEVDEADGEIDGGADDLSLVFIHGYALNLDCWHFQREHFRGRHRLVFYDQRSHGRSQRSEREHATIEQLGNDLRRVIDELAPGPVVLVGHSMGGMTIMALAEEHPELFGDRVRGVALVATTAGGLNPGRLIVPYLPERLTAQVAERAVAALARGPRFVEGLRRTAADVGIVVTDWFAFGDDVPSDLVYFVDEMLSGTQIDVIAEFFPNFGQLDKFAVLEALDNVPTYLICGTEDRLTSIGHSRKMKSVLPSARLVEVERAGHMVIMERAKQVNAALEDLVAAARRTRGAEVGP